MSLGEFELIGRYFTGRDQGLGVKLGVGDDCALLEVPEGFELAITTDTQNEGVHFFKGTDPYLIGYKSLLVNVSDLAAMGARPFCFTLSLNLPKAQDSFLAAFSQGLFALAGKLKLPLIGGNTSKGPLSVSITACGLVKQGRAMRRDLARIGDDVYVTGTLGLPGLAVAAGYGRVELDSALFDKLYEKSMLIGDRCAFAEKLGEFCRCAIDVSDGLKGDLGHILSASKVGAVIDIDLLPRPEEIKSLQIGDDVADECCIFGGGDYELLFTLPPNKKELLLSLCKESGVKVTRIGKITQDQLLFLKNGKFYSPKGKAFEHF